LFFFHAINGWRMFFDMEHAASGWRNDVIKILENPDKMLCGGDRIPLIPRIGHGLSTAGLTHGIGHLTTQFLQQFQSGNGHIGVELVHVAGDEEADMGSTWHGIKIRLIGNFS